MRLIIPTLAALTLSACDPIPEYCEHSECTYLQPVQEHGMNKPGKKLPRLILSALAALTLAACTNDIQTTSGKAYLAAYPTGAKTLVTVSDKNIRKAASVEPTLRFPARIGLARIAGGQLTGIPDIEFELWRNLAREHGDLGEFVAISPIIAEFTANSIDPYRYPGGCSQGRWDCSRGRSAVEAVSKIRLGAARQHVDVVLIYEVGSNSNKTNTPLAFADFTLFGSAMLPTRSIEVKGIAQAMLLDVRNGYPYGNARAEADLSGLATTWGADGRSDALRVKASYKVIEQLVPEIDGMFTKLKTALPRARKSSAKKV